MNYVVSVLEPLPADLPAAAAEVAKGLPISSDNVLKLLSKAPGPVTRPVPERDARRVQEVMQGAGLVVEVREGTLDGPVVDLVANERARLTAAGLEAATAQASTPEGASEAGPDGPADDPAPGEAGRAADEQQGDPTDGAGDAGVYGTHERVRATGEERREAPQAGQATTQPPRDPTRTTLVRNPPRLERSGLRRRIASAVTLPALLTLVVTLLAVVLAVLPVLRQEEQRRVSSVVDAVAATVEGLSGGLPLSAPILRLELDAVQARGAAGGWGVDHLLLVDADQSPLVAWYRGRAGLEAFPEDVRDAALARARAALAGPVEEPAAAGDWLGGLRVTAGELLALVGLGTVDPTVAGAQIHRLGAVGGAVVAGAAPSAARRVGAGLLTALLVGLVPVLFGLLATLSLTRGLRESIGYLLVATDRISHGDLDAPVELARDDELGQIAGAVERMRISLRESMERLRQRR